MELKRVESKSEVEAYIFKLKYALQNGAKITFQIDRQVDENRNIKNTNRYTVGGETKFACVDGPEFDGHLVDFDEAMSRGGLYREFEKKAYDEACALFAKAEEHN